MPRSDQYGAAGETWRHISQSGRAPPDRLLIKLPGISVTPEHSSDNLETPVLTETQVALLAEPRRTARTDNTAAQHKLAPLLCLNYLGLLAAGLAAH